MLSIDKFLVFEFLCALDMNAKASPIWSHSFYSLRFSFRDDQFIIEFGEQGREGGDMSLSKLKRSKSSCLERKQIKVLEQHVWKDYLLRCTSLAPVFSNLCKKLTGQPIKPHNWPRNSLFLPAFQTDFLF